MFALLVKTLHHVFPTKIYTLLRSDDMHIVSRCNGNGLFVTSGCVVDMVTRALLIPIDRKDCDEMISSDFLRWLNFSQLSFDCKPCTRFRYSHNLRRNDSTPNFQLSYTSCINSSRSRVDTGNVRCSQTCCSSFLTTYEFDLTLILCIRTLRSVRYLIKITEVS